MANICVALHLSSLRRTGVRLSPQDLRALILAILGSRPGFTLFSLIYAHDGETLTAP
jgi:hypothetical protein